MLDARNLRKHAQDDKNATVRQLAEAVQKKVFLGEETRIAAALSKMSVSNPLPGAAKPLPEEDKYRIETSRCLISLIADIEDKLARLQRELDTIGTPPNSSIDDRTILETLKDIEAVKSSAEVLDRDLKMISRRSKVPSVASVRVDVEAAVEAFLAQVQGTWKSWKALQDERDYQRKEDLASGATEYDSGE